MSIDLKATENPEVITKLSTRSVSATLSRLQETIRERQLKVFAVIDQSAEAASVGLELRETVIVLFGSPAAGTPVMAAEPLAALDLPLKILIWDDDGETMVSYLSPRALAARYGLPEDLGKNLAGIDTITDILVAP